MQQEYRVELDAYSGPLDLLLYLVRRDEIDLLDIPIARLTEQYVEHIKLIQQEPDFDVNAAGEFLVMAATLLEIKSQMLVPRAPEIEGEQQAIPTDQNPLDPRYELVQQLLEYKRFKDAAGELDRRREEWEARFAHLPARSDRPQIVVGDLDGLSGDDSSMSDLSDEDAAALEIDLEDASVLDLCEAFARILESIGKGPAKHEVVYDDTPIGLHAEDIADRLAREGPTSLQQIFEGRTRAEAIGLFLAMLEMVRQRRLKVIQEQTLGPDGKTIKGGIKLELRPPEEAAIGADHAQTEDPNRWRNADTGEVDYEWPSEDARQRAERRAKLRAARAAKGEFGATEGHEDEIIDVDGEADEEPSTQAEAGRPGNDAANQPTD